MKSVKASAPGKVFFTGEHAVVYSKPCIVTAVDQRITVEVTRLESEIIEIQALDVGIRDYKIELRDINEVRIPKQIKFVLTAIKNFYESQKTTSGLKVVTKSDFSSKFGFGSSSAGSTSSDSRSTTPAINTSVSWKSSTKSTSIRRYV